MLFLALSVPSHPIPHLKSFCLPAAADIATFPHPAVTAHDPQQAPYTSLSISIREAH